MAKFGNAEKYDNITTEFFDIMSNIDGKVYPQGESNRNKSECGVQKEIDQVLLPPVVQRRLMSTFDGSEDFHNFSCSTGTPPEEQQEVIKNQPALLPWMAIMEICKLMTMMELTNNGKHYPGKWKKNTVRQHMDAAIRHYYEWHSNKIADDESGLHPLTHMATRLLMALEVYMQGIER